jgi:hypothetical protein
MSESQLKNTLLALFLRAEAEGRRDTAEHLMRALETLCTSPDDAASEAPPARSEFDVAPERR